MIHLDDIQHPVAHVQEQPASAPAPERSVHIARELPRLPGLFTRLLQAMGNGRESLDLVSPYFVPAKDGTASLADRARSGIKVRIVTNSLASTDEPLTYLGYARYRHEMLGLGVRITEVSPTGAPRLGLRAGLSASVGRLHAKVAMVDRRWLLIGSLNMDARSSRTNTELALVIDSAELAEELSSQLHAQWRDGHYWLRRTPAGAPTGAARKDEVGPARWRVEWVSAGAGSPGVHRSEPGVGPLARSV